MILSGFPHPDKDGYDIGQLISYLPTHFYPPHRQNLLITYVNVEWMVTFKDSQLKWTAEELIDALFEACVFLKQNSIL